MKKIKVSILSILMIILFSFNVFAAETPTLYIENYELVDGQLNVYVSSNQELTDETLNVKVDSTELTIDNITTVGEQDCACTYLFLIDVSGSISDSSLLEIKEILNLFVDNMGSNDNASFMMLGDNLVTADLVYGQTNMEAQINDIVSTNDDTNLYSGIIEALDILNTNAEVNTKRNLIIISDGEDYYSTGYTREEVEAKIERTNIPVDSIAMLSSNSSSDILECAKILGSFSRLSAGGIDTTYGLDDITASEVVSSIQDAHQGSYIISLNAVDLSQDSLNSKELLTVSLSNDNGNVSDEMDISTLDIQAYLEEVEASERAETSEEVTEIASSTILDVAKDNYLIITAISLGVLMLIVIICILIFKSKKKAKNGKNVDEVMTQALQDKDENVQTSAPKEIKTVAVQVSKENKITMTLTKLGKSQNTVYNMSFNDEFTIGRSKEKSSLAIIDDALLSSVHCKIFFNNGQMSIMDLSSTNGTYLNGIPVKTACVLHKDDIILIGAMELRVNWN